MFTEILSEEYNQHFINVKLETGNKKIVPVTGTMVVFLLSEQAGGTLNAEPDEQAEQNGGP